jgi:thioredoxin reductase (NADPH)
MDRMESQAETLGAKIETGEEIQNIESAKFFLSDNLSGISIQINCYCNGKHISYHDGEQELIGSVHFVLLVMVPLYQRDKISNCCGNSASKNVSSGLCKVSIIQVETIFDGIY